MQNKRLKILFLLQDVPFPISDGMRWKVFYLLKYLSARHQCDVIAFADRTPNMTTLQRELPAVNWLAIVPRDEGVTRTWNTSLQLLAGRPASLGRFHSGEYEKCLHEAVRTENYDVLHFDIVNMAQYWRSDVASVHSPNDATSLFYCRMAQSVDDWVMKLRLKLGAFLLRRFEQKAYPKFTKIHVVSNVDADYLRHNVPGADVVFIPFGVEGEKSLSKLTIAPEISSSRNAPLILVLGGANVPGVAAGIQEFIKSVLPQVATRFPKAEFRIQGRGTDRLLERLEVSEKINVYASTWVDDLDALIQTATLVVLPDKAGTGIKTRALQALACGAAIVGTKVAFEGLQEYVQNGTHCMIANTPDELALQLNELLSDDTKRKAMGNAATTLVRTHLSWSHLGPQYEALYFHAVEKFRQSMQPANGQAWDIEGEATTGVGNVAPKISVCIPAYNRAALLPVLLDSIFSQNYENLEVVIAEDNSPERQKIAAVAHVYAERYPGCLVYEENIENLGYDGNLRRLIEVASGEYVVFMGNDDLMAEGALAAIAGAIGRYPKVGVVLRSYASFKTTPEKPEQVFRYFDKEAFFPAGANTVTTFFRRCVFISGMVVRRDSALCLGTNRFDGTLLYQQYLIGEILARENGVYLPRILSYHRLGGVPDFGNSAVEKGAFVPRQQTIASSVHFMRGMLSIAGAIENSTGLAVFRPIVRDIGNYAYPILSIQAQRPRREFMGYIWALAGIGLWRVPMFHLYAIGLLVLRRDVCDRIIAGIKHYLGRAPKIGRVYSGQE